MAQWRSINDELDNPIVFSTDKKTPPTSGVFDAPTRLVPINGQWWSHVSGLLAVMTNEGYWDGTPEEIAIAIHQVNLLLSANEESMVQDIQFSDDWLLQKMVAGEWVDAYGADTLKALLQAIQLSANQANSGVLSILNRSDEAYSGYAFLGSLLDSWLNLVADHAEAGLAIALSLRDVTDAAVILDGIFIEHGGFVTSALEALIASGGFDPSALEADILAAAAAAAAAQASADSAITVNDTQNGRLDVIEADITSIQSILDELMLGAFWAEMLDFEVDAYGASPINAVYTSGAGFVHTYGTGQFVLQMPTSVQFQENQLDTIEVGFSFQSAILGAPTITPEFFANGSPYANINFTSSGGTGKGFYRIKNNPSVGMELEFKDWGSYTVKYIRYWGRGTNPF